MAQPLAFSVVVTLVTFGLLYVARQSQDLLESSEDRTIELADTNDQTEQFESRRTEDTPLPDSSGEHEPNTPTAVSVDERRPGTAVSTAEAPPEATDLAPAGRPAPETPVRSQPQEIELTPAMVIANVAATQGLIAGLVIGAGWYFAIPPEAFGVTADPFSTGLPAVGIGVAFGVLLWIGNEISTTIADAVGAAYDEGVRELLAPESPGGWLLLFGGVLPIIALSEELLFRAALIGVPAASFGVSPWLLAAISSLAFAFGHGAQGRVGVVVTGLLGFVLAAGYVLSGSLLLVIVAHYVVNAAEFFVHEYLGIELDGIATPE